MGECSAGYHGPTEAPTTTQAPTTARPTTQYQCSYEGCDCAGDIDCDSGFCIEDPDTGDYFCRDETPCGNPYDVCYFDADCCDGTCIDQNGPDKQCSATCTDYMGSCSYSTECCEGKASLVLRASVM